MFEQYLEMGGNEIANAERVVKYVDKNAPQIPLRKRTFSGTLHQALGEDDYESPTVDNAPWLDPSNPATAKFYGVYPLSISGIENSTRSATVTDTLTGGGTVSAERYGPKAIRVRALLVGESKQAIAAGMTWLDSALRPSDCDDHGGSCGGAKLCYYSAEPPVCDEWEPTYQAGFSAPVLAASAAGGRTVVRYPEGDSIYKANLEDPEYPHTTQADGAVIRWGTVSRDDTSLELESYGPIVRQRTNLFPRPNALADDLATFWTGRGPNGTAADGPGGDRAFLTVPKAGATAVLQQTASDPVVPPAGPLILSMDLRSAIEQTVTVELRDPATNAVLRTVEFVVTDQWRRYSFPMLTTANFYLRLSGTEAYDATGFGVEVGALEMPYLDGNEAWQDAARGYITGAFDPEYEITWLGTPNKSRSRMRWLGELTVGQPLGSDYGGGSCETWPFVEMLQGEIGGGRSSFALRLKVPTETQVRPYERTMHDVRCIEGPVVIEDINIRTAGAMRVVEFTLVAGKPWAYSTTETLMQPTVMSTLPTFAWPGTDDCPTTELVPILDPDCLVPPLPPRPPEIQTECVVTEPTVQRYWFSIPSSAVSMWSDMVPRMTIASGSTEIRQVRVRAFPNPFDRTSDTDEFPLDPCSWCAEFIVSYLPANTSITVDAILERAFASVGHHGVPQPADNLMYASDGGPMTWPALSCGMSYIFTIDVPEPLLDDVTVSFDLARRE